jgi:hypothetical protein
VAVLVSPSWVGRRDRERAAARAPGWLEEAESWLAPLRAPDSWGVWLQTDQVQGLA